MADIDFIELANYCQNRYKEKNTSDKRRYGNTSYVAITKDDEVIHSATPHALKMAEQCILLHYASEITSSGSWNRYLTQFIDKNGIVYNNRFDENFELCLDYDSLSLKYENCYIAKYPRTNENSIKKLWKLYSRVKDIKSSKEIFLIADLFQKDEKILELEKQIENFKFTNYLLDQERNQYKSLLDDIAKMVENK